MKVLETDGDGMPKEAALFYATEVAADTLQPRILGYRDYYSALQFDDIDTSADGKIQKSEWLRWS